MAVLDDLKKRAAAATKPTESAAVVATHTPAVRKGEDTLSSRPFSMLRLFGAMAGHVTPDQAKLELEMTGAFKKALNETGTMIQGGSGGSQWILGASDLLPYDASEHTATKLLREASGQFTKGVDPDKMLWEAERLDNLLVAMSYLTDSIGGTLVAPAEQGEVIPLMRNQSAVDRAGARMVPLPPQGKVVYPRMTSASTAYWIGENTSITESNPQTGQAEMMAKKLAVLTRVPNELFKYASVSADAMLRMDIAKSLALGFDYACLYGTSGAQPKGLKYYNGSDEVLLYVASTVGTDGDTLNPQDGYLMSSAIEDRNFDLNGWKWIMRPKMWGKIASFRSSSGAVTTADQLGLFVQDLTRKLGDGAPPNWTGYPVVRSSQLPNNLTKGSGTGLTEIWGGVWSEFLMGMYGAVEFAQATQGTEFALDQTSIRGILHADCVPRYAGAFARATSLVIS